MPVDVMQTQAAPPTVDPNTETGMPITGRDQITMAAPQATTPPPTQPTQQVAVAPDVSGQKAPHHGMLGSVYDRVLAGIAGPRIQQVPYIDKDPQSKTYGQTFTRPVDQGAGSQWRSIIASMLTGLAAGSQVPPQKSGAAVAAAGLGEGFVAERQQQLQMKDRQRKQMGEDFEREQKGLLLKHDIAKTNILNYRNMLDADNLRLDQDPERKANIDTFKAMQKESIPGVQMMTEQEWKARFQSDPTFAATHGHMKAGFAAPEQDNVTGETKPGQGMVVTYPIDSQGNFAAPPSLVEQLKKYAKYSGRADLADQLAAGQPLSVQQFAALEGAKAEGQSRVMAGELNPKLMWEGPNHDQPVLRNPVTTEVAHIQTAGTGGIPTEAKEAQSKEELRTAQSEVAEAKSKEAAANAQTALQALNFARQMAGTPEQQKERLGDWEKAFGELDPRTKSVYAGLPPMMQGDFLGLLVGEIDPKREVVTLRKGTGQQSWQAMKNALLLADPTWNEGKFDLVKRVNDDFANPHGTGGQINSFNKFMLHAADLVKIKQQLEQASSSLGVPIIDLPLNEAAKRFGGTYVNRITPAIKTMLNEYQSFISTNAPTAMEKNANDAMLDSGSTLGQIFDNAQTMVDQATDRLYTIDQTYKTNVGRSYPNLVYPETKQAAAVFGTDVTNRLSKFGSGGQIMTGKTPISGPAGSQGITPVGTDAGGKTIGWNGQQFVYVDTGKPYVPPSPAGVAPAPSPAAQQTPQIQVPTP